jgi:hypothetical protein
LDIITILNTGDFRSVDVYVQQTKIDFLSQRNSAILIAFVDPLPFFAVQIVCLCRHLTETHFNLLIASETEYQGDKRKDSFDVYIQQNKLDLLSQRNSPIFVAALF